MKNTFRSLLHSLRQKWTSPFLIFLTLLPAALGYAVRFGLPKLEIILCAEFGKEAVIAPFYFLFDILLGTVTAVIYMFTIAFTKSENQTDGGENILFRFGVGTGFAFAYSLLTLYFFSITFPPFPKILLIAAVGAFTALSVSLMTVWQMTCGKNNTAAILLLIISCGAAIPFFVDHGVRFLNAFLPTFWLSEYLLSPQWLSLSGCAVSSAFWIIFFYYKISRKI